MAEQVARRADGAAGRAGGGGPGLLGLEAEDHLGDERQPSHAPEERAGEVVAGDVLEHAAPGAHHLAVGEHRLDAGERAAGHLAAGDQAAGVDRRRSSAGEADQRHPGAVDGHPQRDQGRPGAGADHHRPGVHADLVEAAERDADRPSPGGGVGDRPADHADRRAQLRAGPADRDHLGGAPRADRVEPGVDAPGADDRGEPGAQLCVHDRPV